MRVIYSEAAVAIGTEPANNIPIAKRSLTYLGVRDAVLSPRAMTMETEPVSRPTHS